MKIIANKKITNKIIIAIILVVTLNFATPNYTRAFDFGDLFDPVAELLCSIGDLAIKFLQKSFLGEGTIKDIGSEGGGTYHIYYGPKNIFSGVIPVFDINFINPSEKNTVTIKTYNTSTIFNASAIAGKGGTKILSEPYSGESVPLLGKNSVLKKIQEGIEEYNYEAYDESRDITGNLKSTTATSNKFNVTSRRSTLG